MSKATDSKKSVAEKAVIPMMDGNQVVSEFNTNDFTEGKDGLIAALKSQVGDLQTANANLNEAIAIALKDKGELTDALEAANKLVLEHASTIQAHENAIAQKDIAIENLSEQVQGQITGSVSFINDESKKPIIPSDLVEIDGDSYVFQKALFTFKGTTHKAEEAFYNPDLLYDIITIPGQTVLRKVE